MQIEIRTPESDDERAARIKRAGDDDRHQRQIFWAVFGVVIVAAAIALIIALLSNNQGNADWARTLFSSIIAGLVGYVVGGGGKPSDS